MAYNGNGNDDNGFGAADEFAPGGFEDENKGEYGSQPNGYANGNPNGAFQGLGGGGSYQPPPGQMMPSRGGGGGGAPSFGASVNFGGFGGGGGQVGMGGMGGFQPFPDTQNVLSSHFREKAKLVSEIAAEQFAKDVTNDIGWCYNLMLYYGLSPTEVLLVMVRYREAVLKQFMDKEGQFSRQIEDSWLENKITSLPKPEGEGEAQEIARQMEIVQSMQRDLVTEGARMRDLCQQGVAQVQKPLNEFLNRLKKVVSALQWLSTRVPNKELSADQQNAIRLWSTLVDKLITRNASLVHFVSIFGLEKAGKTTTLCAWLRDALLPMAKYRCTFVPNSLHSSPAPIMWARVYVRGAKEFKEQLYGAAKEKTIDLEMIKMEHESKKLLTIEEAVRYIEEKSVDALRTVGNYFDIKEADEGKARYRLNQYVATYTLSFVTVRVEVYTPQLQIKDGVEWGFCDLAGTDSPHPEHHQQAHEQIQKSEAFILCKSGDRPALLGPEMELIKSVKERDPNALSKAFAFITRLDCKDEGEVNGLIKQGTEALVAVGFQPANIFVVCPFYHLTKHRIAKDASQVTAQDKETYSHIEKTSVKEVLNGFERAQIAVENYVKQSLPMKRVDDGIALAEQLRTLIHYVCDGVQVVAPTVATAAAELRKNRRNQFENLWNDEWNKLMDDAAEGNYGHMIVKREERKAEVRKRYQDTLKVRFNEMKKKFDSIPPRVRIARSRTFNTGVDVHAVEKKCREEQLDMFLVTIDVLTTDLCALVDKNVQEYGRHLTTVFTNKYRVDTTEIFDCSKLVPTEDCRCQIHSLLMRAAYPLGLSVLRWPHNVAERMEAIVVLAEIAPVAAQHVVHSRPGGDDKKGLPSNREIKPEGPMNAIAPNVAAKQVPVSRAPPSGSSSAAPPNNRAVSTANAQQHQQQQAAANPKDATVSSNSSTPPTSSSMTAAGSLPSDGLAGEIGQPQQPVRSRFQAAQPVAIPPKRT